MWTVCHAVKLYGAAPESAKGRYSPAECTGARKMPVEGAPDPKHISTSYAERQNLTMRMHMRRFTRLTNARRSRTTPRRRRARAQWGAWVAACLGYLQHRGCCTRSEARYEITAEGRAALARAKEVMGSRDRDHRS